MTKCVNCECKHFQEKCPSCGYSERDAKILATLREDTEEQISDLLNQAMVLARENDCEEFLAMKCIRFAKDGEF